MEEEAKAGKAENWPVAERGAERRSEAGKTEDCSIRERSSKGSSAQACQTDTWQKRSRDRRSFGKTARGQRGMVPAQTHAEKRAGRHQGAGTGKMLAEEARRSFPKSAPRKRLFSAAPARHTEEAKRRHRWWRRALLSA